MPVCKALHCTIKITYIVLNLELRPLDKICERSQMITSNNSSNVFLSLSLYLKKYSECVMIKLHRFRCQHWSSHDSIGGRMAAGATVGAARAG